MNILPVIKFFLATFPRTDTLSKISRKELEEFLTSKVLIFRNVNDEPTTILDDCGIDVKDIELVIDCLIAAGIGREAEQNQTVYCHCSGG